MGRLRRRLGRKLGDFDFSDIAPVLTTGLNDAAMVAKVALAPTPTTQIAYPSGLVATASGGAMLPALSSSLTGTGIASSSSLLLFGGLGLVLVLVLAG